MTKSPVAVSLTPDQVSSAWLARYTSANTRAAYGGDLRTFLAWCARGAHNPFAATAAEILGYRQERESTGVGAATIARHFAALRAFYAAAEEFGACPTSPFEGRPAGVVTESATGVMTRSDVEKMYLSTAADPRCAVLVRLLLGDGLRLSECLAIDHEHITGSTRTKRVRVQRHGRATIVELSAATSADVARLQRVSSKGGPLLLGQSHGAAAPERLTRFGADFLLKQAAQAVGIRQMVSANVLRRTHAALAHEAGTHVDDIRDRMGHRDVRTTRRYLTPAVHPPAS